MDVLTIHNALLYACSQDPHELKLGEKQLTSWEKEKGYYGGLATVFGDHNVESTIRWMALTCLKNGIDSYWRPTAPNAIDDKEKQLIRTTLLNSIEEPEHKISLQLAVLTARIARIDCPHNWPELLPALTEKVRSDSPLLQKCSLLTLQEVIKAFTSWRLSDQRLTFFEITGSLFAYIAQVWIRHLTSVSTSGNETVATDSLSLANICLKVLQLMLLYGFARFNVEPDAIGLVGQLFELAPKALELRVQLPLGQSSHEAAERTVTLIIKTLFKLQRNHPIGYIAFIDRSFQLIYSTIFNLDKRDQLYEGYIVYGLNLMKAILKCEDYMIPLMRGLADVPVPPQVLEAQKLKRDFFNSEHVEVILQQLITQYMLLTSEDLEKWEDSPEEFPVSDEAPGQLYMFSLKGSVEGALTAVVHEVSTLAVPLVLQMITYVQDITVISDTSSLLVKEAVYNAAGLLASDLYQHLDFETWFQNHLINELAVKDTRYRIIRRRIVWLLGCWVGVKFDAVYRPVMYRAFLSALSPTEDIVVRLTAVDSLKQAVDDIGFTTDEISPFIPDTMQLLLKLLVDSQSYDTKLSVMTVFSQLIERVGSAIQPYIGALLEHIPHIWAEVQRGGDNSSLLHCVIISTLSHMVRSLSSLSIQLHPFVIPVIHQATDVKQREHLFLAEDGLELWNAVLHHTPQPSMELVQLLGNMSGLLGLATPTDDSSQSMEGLMDIGSNSLILCFDIIDAYIVLCSPSPELFIQHCADLTVKACQSYIRDVKQTGVDAIVTVLDHMMVAYTAYNHQILQSLLLQLLHCVLNGEETYAPTLCLYLAVLARAMLCNAQHFIAMLQTLAPQLQQEVNTLLGILLDIWAYRLDNIGEVKRRKLFGLAAASLLTVNDTCVINRFSSLLDMCVEVLHDVTDVSTSGGEIDLLVFKGVDAYPINTSHKPHSSMTTEHDRRVRQLYSQDPVWNVSLPQLVKEQLERCLITMGVEQYHTLMSTVDGIIREQLADFVPHERVNILLLLEI